MKFVRYNGGKTGLVVGDGTDLRVIDIQAGVAALRRDHADAAERIAAVLPPGDHGSWVEMIGQWDAVRDAFLLLQETSDTAELTQPMDDCSIEAPLADPQVRMFAIGSNTAVHIIRAMKVMLGADLTEEQVTQSKRDGLPPFGFTVWPSTVVGPDATVAPPRGTRAFDYEGECAVYVKSAGRYQDEVAIWGYTAFNDLGVRDTHLKLAKEANWGPFSFNPQKNFDSGKACGPWVSVDEVEDISRLRCVVTVNGEPRQNWGLDEMIYGFNETLSFLSQGLTLRPGDMLASGTGAGVAIEGGVDGPHWLKPGDVVEVTLDGIAPLRNVVGDW